MNHLGTATRGATGEILSLDQRHGQTSQRRITRDATTSDAAANYQQVESSIRQRADGAAPVSLIEILIRHDTTPR